jgi:hypothetical protein
MTLDLSRTLHAAVDLADDDSPGLDLGPVTARIRRRRHVRTGVRAGVGVAAAGAVALTANHLTQPATVAGLPAARADAEAGECGSDIALLDRPASPGAGLLDTLVEDANRTTVPRAGGHLGTYVGSWLTVQAVEDAASSPAGSEARIAALRARLAADQQKVTALQADGASADALAAARHQVDLDDAALTSALEAAAEAPDGVATNLRLYVTHRGTVVATDPLASEHAVPLWQNTDAGLTGVQIDQPLVTCDTPGAVGGEPLPAGTYDVYVGYGTAAADATPVAVAGPWHVTVAHPSTSGADLPVAFPRAMPLIGGRVDSVSPLDGGGWLVNVATDAADAAAAAGQLLTPVADASTVLPRLPHGREADPLEHPVAVRLADGSTWTVTVEPFQARDGSPSLVYRITPRISSDDAGS